MAERPEIDAALQRVREIRDMSDFCEAWPQIRLLFDAECLDHRDDHPEIEQGLDWLISFADKLCVIETDPRR
ncbi:MAG: hypothetical protein AAFY73_05775 [Pseudomonadota bacterium]